ncbi:MAG: hypothetical protein IT180_01200 [Acidobacteria bacterium]|nr:hypothetical protein [Acidobacteriota bacterium]
MHARPNDLGAILAEVRRRWMRRVRLSAWTAGASAAAMLVGVGGLTVWLLASEGLPLVFVVGTVVALVAVTLGAAARPIRRPPSELQIARYVEEQAGGLDDIVVTAVQHGQGASPVARRLSAAAAARVEAVGLDRLVSGESLRRAAMGAVAASAALAVAGIGFAPTLGRGASIAAAYLLPSRLLIDVSPGTAKVRVGTPVTITARVHGVEAGLVPELLHGEGDRQSVVRMTPTGDGAFTTTFDKVTSSFPYFVIAGPARSEDFAIEAIRPARVQRIDLQYRYPDGLGLEPRVEEDAGDIYGPKGTRVELTITADKPIARGALTMADGSHVPLDGQAGALTAIVPIAADGSYRVALTDIDGLDSPGDTEYFIRMLDDRPPDVRVMRPAGDKQVSPLEEVLIEARADDDFGLSALELVFQVPGQKDTVVPIETRRALTASGQHLVQLEALGVAPGDFVTYYARARDVGQGRRGTESRSDIYFLEVKPFEEAFVAAQSQAMGMQGGDPGLQELAEAQKEIIAATWKLDARARRARDAKSATDIKAVADAQRELRTRAAESAGEMATAMADPRRRRPGQSQAPGGDDPLARAVEAMGRASGELDRLRTAEALPHEMSALEHLLKADADVKQRQVSRQQQAGGGGSNRQTPDLSTLFDQQLRKQQETNYETPDTTETAGEQKKPEDDPLARVRELARRQEALQRAQQELARNRDRLEDEEVKRQIERLTREQQQLSEQASDLSRQLQRAPQASAESQRQDNDRQSTGQQSSASSGGGQSGQQAGAGDRSSSSGQLREIAEQMKGASGELQRQDPDQASARSGEAVEQLRELSRQMERSQPGERKRATGGLQFEARQLADAERRLASESDRVTPGSAGEQSRRRLAGEQERLAERADRLREAARQMGTLPDAGEEARLGRAAREAAGTLDRERVAERMRAAAENLRQEAEAGGLGAESRDLARALDQVAGGLGEAAGTADAETERLSTELARTGELRDRISELQQTLRELEREAASGQDGRPGQQAQPDRAPSPGQDARQGQPGGPSSEAQGRPDGSRQSPASPSAQQGSPGTEGAGADPGSADGGRPGQLARLQREAAQRMSEARRLADELREQNPEMRNAPPPPEDWSPSLSAPGTEAFKQDFSRWESLKQNLLVALERTETRLAGQLRERETRERLNAGGHEGVSDTYRAMVGRYYESLASPRKPPR